MTKYCWVSPIPASSLCVRTASFNVAVCARATRTRRVFCGSASASTAALYWVRCFSSPANGPRHEASPLPSSRKPLQAPGNCNMRMVWPVGAVSNTMWSNSCVSELSINSAVNSSNAAISVVHAPESCSSMPLTIASGRMPRTGPTMRSR